MQKDSEMQNFSIVGAYTTTAVIGQVNKKK